MEASNVDVEQFVGLLRDAARAAQSVTMSPTERAKAFHAANNALAAAEAETLAEIDETKAHEADGAASVATWAARELHQDVGVTRQMVRAAKTLRVMPLVGGAVHAGKVALGHVQALTFGLNHIGFQETLEVESELVTLAEAITPKDLFTEMRRCQAIAHPDRLDEAWLKGMAKQDFQCSPVGDGYHVKGFLPIDVGAKLRVYLQSTSVPREADDTRTAAQRRVDALDRLVSDVLGSGDLHTENSISPHVSVIVDAETLRNTLNQSASDAAQQELLNAEPAILEGFGPIGPALLSYIAFGGNLTPIMVAEFKANRRVLDVGRSSRIATVKQRKAIGARQLGRCANRGCHHPIGEVHHVHDWLYGGKTNLANPTSRKPTRRTVRPCSLRVLRTRTECPVKLPQQRRHGSSSGHECRSAWRSPTHGPPSSLHVSPGALQFSSALGWPRRTG